MAGNFRLLAVPLRRIRLRVHPAAQAPYEAWCLRQKATPLQNVPSEVLTSALVGLQIPAVSNLENQHSYLAIGGFQGVEICGALIGRGVSVEVHLKVFADASSEQISRLVDGDLFLHAAAAPAVQGEMTQTLLSQLSPAGATLFLGGPKPTRARIGITTGIRSVLRSSGAKAPKQYVSILESIFADMSRSRP